MIEYLDSLSPQKLAELDELLFDDSPSWSKQSPWPKQKLFLDLDCLEAFYGGAAGPGKSSALLMAALKYVDVPGYAALLLRRTYADLSKPGALMDRAHQWLSPFRDQGVSWNEQKKTWTFPKGATLSFGYLETENDKYRYQGAEYQFIGFDELTQFTESQFTYLFSRLRRLKGSTIPIRMRAASNPGGEGAAWVEERFVPADFTPDQAVEPRVIWKEGEDSEGTLVRRAFVPARLEDNPALDYDEYVQSLNELDPVTREQLLKGDWSIRERGDIYWMWDERYHVITWTEFANVYQVRHIPFHWKLGVFQDQGTTEGHPGVTSWFGTAAKNGPLPGTVFIYRGLTVVNMAPEEVGEKIVDLMKPHAEMKRTEKWRNSHEAKSERLSYARQSLPFSTWKAGPNVGIAQVRDYLTLIDRDKPNPFRPTLMGRSRLVLVVDDDQFLNPKDDKGLARHRAEFPAYHYKNDKPDKFFDDAMDTVKAAAVEYFPRIVPLTDKEMAEARLPDTIKIETIKRLPEGETKHRAVEAHDFWSMEFAPKDDEEKEPFYLEESLTRR